ncbi:MAG: phage tail tube protein [Inhella sp.]
MSYSTLVGAQFFISSGLDGAKNVTAISNAAPPAVTSAAHGYVDNDEVLLLTGWEEFNESVFRVDQIDAATFTLPGYSSANTDFYPAAGAPGTAQKISSWIPLGQILDISASGGDAQFEELSPFDRRNGIKLPTGFSGSSLEMTLGWDRSRADQQAIQAASRILGKKAFKFVLPGGVYGYAYGTVSASALPSFEKVLKQKVSLTMSGMFTSF